MATLSRRYAMRTLVTLAALTLLALPAVAQSAAGSDLSGTWRGDIVTDGPSGTMTLVFGFENGEWKVTNNVIGEGIPDASATREIKVEGSVFSFWQTFAEFESFFRGTVEADGMLRGTVEAFQAGTPVATGTFVLKKD